MSCIRNYGGRMKSFSEFGKNRVEEDEDVKYDVDLVTYCGFDSEEYGRYRYGNSFIDKMKWWYGRYGKLSKKQAEVVYNMLVEVRLLCSLYDEVKRDGVREVCRCST